MTMYADDSTLYMSAPKASELTEFLNKKLQSVSEWSDVETFEIVFFYIG